jgi:membrane-associated phospholipid phosphatase
MKKLALIISSIIHPVILPLVTFWILLWIGYDNLPNRGLYYAIIFCSCTVILGLGVMLLKRLGKIPDLDVSSREKRTLPFLIGIFSYVLGVVVLYWLGAPEVVWGFLLCYAVNTFFIFLITFKWKISVHVTSVGGPLAALIYMFGWKMLWLLPIAPLVAWSRVKLGAHTPMQTVAGFSIGFFCTFLELLWWFGRSNAL